MSTFAERSSKSRKVTHRPFTLLEILTVCAIIAFLMAMMVAGYGIVTKKGAEAQCKSTMEIIKTALESYKAKTGYYPQFGGVQSDFLVDKPDPTNLDFTEFIDYEKMRNTDELDTPISSGQAALLDPFGDKFWYRCPGTHNRTSFDLESAGADGQFGYSSTLSNDKDYTLSANKTHTTIARPDAQADNIKNWE